VCPVGTIGANTLPALAKAGANYMNSQLMKMEAITNGYVEAIALDSNGYVSEGSGENVFVVRDGRIHTPPLGLRLPESRAIASSTWRASGHSAGRDHSAARDAVHCRRGLFLRHRAEITPSARSTAS